MFKNQLGEHGSEMLQRAGLAQLPLRRQPLGMHLQAVQNKLRYLAGRHASLFHELVEGFVLVTVMGFLTDKAFYLLFQQRISQVFLEVADRTNKETLALRESTGQCGQQQGLELIAAKPVALDGWIKLEIHLPWLDIAVVGTTQGGLGAGIHMLAPDAVT